MEFLSREGDRHCFILKDQEKSSKQTSQWFPQTEQQTHWHTETIKMGRNQPITKPWPFEFLKLTSVS